ncbi:hypothetical protein [Methylocystis echinoides]|uniref:Uncharacterized protein n=1 Tax=Methylocystis echinoides TaxID=29468 RepID=A0A9W6LTU7_9HYPH|nr:hypothetical protein [Methylocystis echinoides]GLI94881.1 hypothetical protein LMG27198_38730 [Methylocystis echinoides]
MSQRLLQQTALLAALFRSVFSNTVAGLITALLLGYWMPIERMAEQAAPRTESARLNVDPVSGKLLDRIDGAAAALASRPAPGPILMQIGFAGPSVGDAPVAMEPVRSRAAPAKPGRMAAPKAADAGPKTAQVAAIAEGPELSDAPQPQPQKTEESESWMSRFSPANLTARVAPMGREIASGVASKAAGAGRAVADRLGGLL